MTTRNLTCRELDERLDDYLEGSLDDSAVADMELHLSGCLSCAALVRDFESIARQGTALPALIPSRDLWPAIEARIGTPVVSIAAAPVARHSFLQRVRTGAIAAGLMGLTAAVTYTMTRQHDAPTVAALPYAPATASGTPSTSPSGATPSRSSSPLVSGESASSPNAVSGANAPSSAGNATLVARREGRASPTVTYDAEISSLRDVLRERSEQLDPRTVAVLQSSIATIDSAIAQARGALQRDPASRFLSSQLDKALEKKLGLLRTAALLPARS